MNMRMHGQGPRRGQSYNNRGQRPPHGSLESTGPGGRLRGNAQQLADRYTTLGREAITQREFLEAESFFQYAEHYKRLAAGHKKHQENKAHTSPRQDESHSASENNKFDQAPTLSSEAEPSVGESGAEALPTFLIKKEGSQEIVSEAESPQITSEADETKVKPRAKASRPRAPRKKPLKKEEKSETLVGKEAE